MSLDELRATLRDHARDVSALTDPIPPVRARIRRRAHAKTAVLAGALAAVVVVAAAVVPGVLPRRDVLPAQRPSPSPTSTATLKTSVFRTGFPTRVDGDPLIASYVGPKGPSTGSFTFTATGHAISLRPVCTLPRVDFEGLSPFALMLSISLDGHRAYEVACSPEGISSTAIGPVAAAALGHSMKVTLSVGVDHGPGMKAFVPTKVPGAQLALGVYDHAGHTQTKAGVTLSAVYGTPGHELHLRSFITQRLSSRVRDLRATLPASRHSIVLASGGGHGRGTVTATVHGRPGDSVGGTAGGVSYDPLPAGKRRTVVVHASQGVTGTLVFAYYSR